LAFRCDGVSGASNAVDLKLIGHTVGERYGKTPTFCVFPVFSVAVMEKCCDACGDGEYCFRSGFSTLQCDGVPEVTTAFNRRSMGHMVGEL
jgi:hypothetical protein